MISNACRDGKLDLFPFEGIDSIADAWDRVCQKYKDANFQGTRGPGEGRPYVWKTYGEVRQIVDNITKAIMEKDMAP